MAIRKAIKLFEILSWVSLAFAALCLFGTAITQNIYYGTLTIWFLLIMVGAVVKCSILSSRLIIMRRLGVIQELIERE